MKKLTTLSTEKMTRILVALVVGGLTALALVTGGQAHADTTPTPLNRNAPELIGEKWLNTPSNRALPLSARKGKVTIVEFWTFGCINCRRNLPAYARWHKQFADKDVAVIGVHTPETEAEKKPSNVIRRVKQLGIEYPVLLDTKSQNWARWKQEFWPTVYLIGRDGKIRYRWEGELDYQNAGGEAKIAQKVKELLAEK